MSSTERPLRVLISGAGIAGPTLAWFLAQSGTQVTVVEKSQSLLAQGQNIDIQGTAQEVIDRMGLLQQIRDRNTTEKGTQFIDSKGKPFALFPVQAGNRASPTSEFEILRGDLAAVLYGATKDHSNVDYLFGTTVGKLISNDNNSVKVELSDGQVEHFDLVVAADGQWSRLRKQCFASDAVKVVDKNAYIAYYTVPRQSNDNDWWNVYQALRSRVISTRPDPYGTIRASFSYMPTNAAQKEKWDAACRSDRNTQQELVREEFADAGWHAQRLLKNMDDSTDFYFQAVQQIRLSTWFKARVVCLGDAAYAPTPFTGMGTSLAILGAYVLAGELSNLRPGEDPSIALQSYETTFRPFVDEIQKIPFFIPGIAHPGNTLTRWLIQSMISICSKLVSISWVGKIVASNSKESSFSLPHYPAFHTKKS